jgi:hypothetical protein
LGWRCGWCEHFYREFLRSQRRRGHPCRAILDRVREWESHDVQAPPDIRAGLGGCEGVGVVSRLIFELPTPTAGSHVSFRRADEDDFLINGEWQVLTGSEGFWAKGYRWWRESTGRPADDPLADWLAWNERQG